MEKMYFEKKKEKFVSVVFSFFCFVQQGKLNNLQAETFIIKSNVR